MNLTPQEEKKLEDMMRSALEDFQRYNFPDSYMRPLIRYWDANHSEYLIIGYQLGDNVPLVLMSVTDGFRNYRNKWVTAMEMMLQEGIKNLYIRWTNDEMYQDPGAIQGSLLNCKDRHFYPKFPGTLTPLQELEKATKNIDLQRQTLQMPEPVIDGTTPHILQVPMEFSMLAEAWKAGWDYAMNGSDMTNCSTVHFESKEKTKAWEAGRDAAEAATFKKWDKEKKH